MNKETIQTEAASAPSGAPRQGFVATDVPAAVLALIAETGLVCAVAINRSHLPLALTAHGIVVLLLLMRAWRLSTTQRDGAAAMLLALMVAIAGPFAALGGLLLGWMSRHGPEDSERLEAWYARISFSTEVSATTQLSDRILTGRIADLSGDMPSSFLGVLANGSIREKQVVLGLIARRFHPDYLPALQKALVSEEPVIRVQAAAVAAKVRGDLTERTDKLLQAAADPTTAVDEALRLLSEAERCVGSGLMEEPDRLRATAVIEGLLAAAADRLDRNPAAARTTQIEPLLGRYEAHLLAQRRYRDFRLLRRDRAWRAKGASRFRPIKAADAITRAGQEPAS